MQSENFDNRVRDAADNHHPNYDETAWAKMESLLDEHMPVEKKRKRRIIFFFLLFIFAGTATWVLIDRPWQDGNSITKASQSDLPADHEKQLPATSDRLQTNDNGTLNLEVQSDLPADAVSESFETKPEEKPNIRTATDKTSTNLPITGNNQFATNTRGAKVGKRQKTEDSESQKASPINAGTEKPEHAKSETIVMSNLQNVADRKQLKNEESNNETPLQVSALENEKKTQSPGVKEDKQEANLELTDDKKETSSKSKRPGKKGNFFISLGVAPDISMVGMKNAGQMKVAFGGGVGFTYNERLTIRAGLFSARKVYSAAPGDYKPGTPLPSPDYLYRIDADCKVFEIPVLLSYNFKKGRNYNLFAGGGLSSYLMKEESYDYVYKYPGDDSEHKYNWSVSDKNKHVFSVATFSLGYERKIGNRFSVTAEPYLKLPLSGVGEGKVKLNSAGILFSLNYSPFRK